MEQPFSPYYEHSAPAEPLWTVDGFDIVRCKSSGLVYLRNPLSDAELEDFYSTEYFEGEASRNGYASYEADEEVLRRNFRSLLEYVTERRAAGGELVDYGCAYGYFLDEARGSFDRVRGIELNEEVADVGRRRFGLDIATDPSAVLNPESVDAITMWDVIEHLKRPRTAVEDCVRALRPGGQLFITTGDISSPLARLMGRRWRLINPPQHITYFSIDTLSSLLADCGLKVTHVTRRCGKQVSLGFVFFILQYMLGSKQQKAPPSWFARRSVYVNLFDTMLVTAVKE